VIDMSGGDTVPVTGAVVLSTRVRFVGTVLLLVAALAGCSTGTDAVDQSSGAEFRFVSSTAKGETIPANDRRLAPAVRGQLLGGGDFDLTAQRGKVVVLNFWASWCAPCRVESPEFDKVYQETRARGVEFVGVNIKDREGPARDFVAAKKISYPSLFDKPGKTALRFRDYPPSAVPSTIVVDREGRVAAVYVTALLDTDIRPVVERLAGE
jgi:thiol-disulfide isomerase/thioredoxin